MENNPKIMGDADCLLERNIRASITADYNCLIDFANFHFKNPPSCDLSLIGYDDQMTVMGISSISRADMA